MIDRRAPVLTHSWLGSLYRNGDQELIGLGRADAGLGELAGADPAVATAAPMAMRRMHLCATLLPDRTVLVNGGSMMEESNADAVFEAEIYHPDAGSGPGTWSMVATSRVARLYHSVALLMPDGKVITSGSNPQRKTEELRIEVFWPPYLFAGDRPRCTPAETFPVRCRDGRSHTFGICRATTADVHCRSNE